MRTHSIIACLLVGLAASMAPAPADAATGFPFAVHNETLDNGLNVILIPTDSGGLISYWTIVRTGARDEVEEGHTGFAHFFEHMMFRGTERFPAEIYNDKVTELGADSNAFTSDDYTAYYLNVAGDKLAEVMDLESDRFRNLSYPEGAFKTEAGAVYGEYRKGRTNPFSAIYEELRRTAFTEHTYAHTPIGFVEDIQAMPTMYDYSKGFFSRFYRPENTTLFIVGDLDVASTLELAKKHYGPWERGYQKPAVPTEPEQTAERRIDVNFEGRSLPVIWQAYKIDAYDSTNKDLLAAELLAELAFGQTSALYKELTLEKQAVEFVGANLNKRRDPSLFDVFAMVKDPAKLAEVEERINQTIAHYQANPPDPERLKALKSRIKYGFLMSLDTPSNITQNLVEYIGLTGGLETVETALATYDSITPADVQNAAKLYLQANRRTVAILRGAN